METGNSPHSTGPEGSYTTTYPGQYPTSVLVNPGSRDKYACVICKNILQDPVQSDCGHRFCVGCSQTVETGSPCPGCEEDGEEPVTAVYRFSPDPGTRRDLRREPAGCGHAGCDWRGPYGEYHAHHLLCPHRLETCLCGVSVPHRRLEEHRAGQCTLRKVPCDYCHEMLPARELLRHHAVCHMVPVDCPSDCGRKLARRDVARHISPVGGDCERARCAFGCEENGGDAHNKVSVVPHLTILLVMLQQLRGEAERAGDGAREVPGCTSNLLERAERAERKVSEIKDKLDRMNGHASPASGDVIPPSASGMRSEYTSSDVLIVDDVIPGRTGTPTNTTNNTRFGRREQTDSEAGRVRPPVVAPSPGGLSGLRDRLDTCEALLAALNRGVEAVLLAHGDVLQQALVTKETVIALQEKVAALERSLALKDVTLAEKETRLRTLESTSHDGTLVWPITEFSRKRREAQEGATPSLFSPVFYTGQAGYKACARIYLNGDGMGRGSHLSFFFVVRRGQYDAVLPWPFRQKVTLMLLDQNNREHVIDAFRPDPTSSSFRRPQSDMNIASGVPLFCPLPTVLDTEKGYVKNDTLFVKIIINTDGL